jgi:hypothetical protein
MESTMGNQPVIMVQVGEPGWTGNVLHAACKMARACGGKIELVHMVRARHPIYLGSELGYLELTEEAEKCLQVYADTVEDYGLRCGVTLYQYCTLYEAIVGAADLIAADVVFAKLPKSIIPLWSDCQFELLRVRLSRQHIELFAEPGIWSAVAPSQSPGKAAAHAFS